VITNNDEALFFLIGSMSTPKKTKFELAVIDKVREMRMKKGFSQEYIAGLLHVTTSFIGGVESPNIASKYNLNHLNKLAHEMECSPKDFMPDKSVVENDWAENED
jgi:transcriptional regulator with XRE-family HTH domain